MLIFDNNVSLDEARDEAQAIILSDLWFYTAAPNVEIELDDSFAWLFILLGLYFKSGVDTLLSEYQYLNPLF